MQTNQPRLSGVKNNELVSYVERYLLQYRPSYSEKKLILDMAAQIVAISQEIANYIHSGFSWRIHTEQAYVMIQLVRRLLEKFIEIVLIPPFSLTPFTDFKKMFLSEIMLAVRYQIVKMDPHFVIDPHELPATYTLLINCLGPQFTITQLLHFVGWDRRSTNYELQLKNKPDNYLQVLQNIYKQLLTDTQTISVKQNLPIASVAVEPLAPRFSVLLEVLSFLTDFYNNRMPHPLKRSSSLINDCALIFIHQTALTNSASKAYTFNGLQPYDFLDEKSPQHGDSNHALVHIYSLYSLLEEENILTIQELEIFLQAGPMQEYCCLVWRAAADAIFMQGGNIVVPVLHDFGDTRFIKSPNKRLPFGNAFAQLQFSDNEKLYFRALIFAFLYGDDKVMVRLFQCWTNLLLQRQYLFAQPQLPTTEIGDFYQTITRDVINEMVLRRLLETRKESFLQKLEKLAEANGGNLPLFHYNFIPLIRKTCYSSGDERYEVLSEQEINIHAAQYIEKIKKLKTDAVFLDRPFLTFIKEIRAPRFEYQNWVLSIIHIIASILCHERLDITQTSFQQFLDKRAHDEAKNRRRYLILFDDTEQAYEAKDWKKTAERLEEIKTIYNQPYYKQPGDTDINSHPILAMCTCNLGQVYLSLNDHAKAAENFQYCLQLLEKRIAVQLQDGMLITSELLKGKKDKMQKLRELTAGQLVRSKFLNPAARGQRK